MRRSFSVLAVVVTLLATVTAAALASTDEVAGKLPDGTVALGDGAYAIPLKAPSPDWYTSELHERAVRAGKQGKSIPIPEDVEVDSALLFAGIRPGSWMISPSGCTLNFVFGDPDATTTSGQGNGNGGGNGNGKGKGSVQSSSSGVYIGTAGHCASVGEEVTIIALPGVIMAIGTTVTSVDNGVGDDFALIEIYPEMVEFVNPSMAIVAGPTGTKAPAIPDPILHVGHGLVVGTGGTARPGVVTWLGEEGAEATAYGWDGAASPGDSGSGVRAATGAAVGNLTHLVVGTRYLPAFIAGTEIDRILQIAGAPLATASLVPNPLP